MINRAYSILTVKRVDDGARIIEGIATTPAPDRVGDIVEPLGVSFKNPAPLLWQHDSAKPVGTVTFGKPTAAGVSFKARIEKIDEPGTLKDRLDEAWQSVKLGLVRAVSIGFRALESSIMKDGGLRFLKTEVLELSLVTVPANSEATITAIKSIDRNLRAATGRTIKPAPGATGHHPSKGKTSMIYADKIEDLEAKAAPKRARMQAILKAALDDDERDLTEAEAEEFDGLESEVKAYDTQIRRFKAIDASAVTAKAVRADDVDSGSRSRGTVPAEAKVPVEKGIGFARFAMCLAAAKGSRFEAVEIAKARYPRDKGIQLLLKAPVSGGTTLEADWAASLVDPTNIATEFVEWLRPQTIIGRFGSGSVPSLRRVPFNIRVPVQNAAAVANWVGEAKGIPVTKAGFEAATLRWTKVAGIAVLSEDLLRFSSPSAELLVRNELGACLVEKLDTDFADPAVTGSTDIIPASITAGSTTSAASGLDAAAVRADVKTAITHFITNNIPTVGLVILMRHSQALSLSLMRNALGQREFPEMTMNGGALEGIPVVASQYVKQGIVAFVSADNIYLADDGAVAIDMSREASLQMESVPTMDAGDNVGSPYTPTATSVVSMFQTDSVALRAIRTITWKKRRTASVYYFTSTGWGNDDTSPPQAAI